MDTLKHYFTLLKTRRTTAMWFVMFFLIVFVIIVPLLAQSQSPLVTSIYAVLLAIVTNMFAALLWYTVLLAHQNLEKTEPLFNVFPFLRNRSQEILIVLTSLPTNTGRELTGIGEARALGILLEAFSKANFPPHQSKIRFSNEFPDEDVEQILRTEQIIVLGGPNFNKFSAAIIRMYVGELDYVFMQDYTDTDDPRRFSGKIVSNRAESQFVLTCPLPEKVKRDTEVVRDCGMIIRVKNQDGRLITMLAGGMATGVWVAAKIMTANPFIQRWYTDVKPDERNSDFGNCPVLC
jgi:hypothetical protein